jgi:hypothetical protein
VDNAARNTLVHMSLGAWIRGFSRVYTWNGTCGSQGIHTFSFIR